VNKLRHCDLFFFQLHYNHGLVQELKQLYLELYPEEDRDGRIWDLCVEDLQEVYTQCTIMFVVMNEVYE